MWFDSHCHLHLCESAEPQALVRAAKSAGVEDLVTIGIDIESSRRALALAGELGLHASVGLHPTQADEWDGAGTALEGLLTDERCVAVGETGLDFYREGVSRDDQEKSFAAHIELAKTHDKALVIHTRESCPAALDMLEAAGPPPRLVFHCWSGTDDDLDRALALGALISFAGNVSFKNAENLRDSARLVPIDRLLVETDSPYLSPQRGHPNEPANVILVGRAVAHARDEPEETIARATTINARSLFGLG